MIVPYLVPQNTLGDRIKANLRDPGGDRWTSAETYRALNDALDMWSNKVSVPALYTVSGGWDDSTYEYTLPYWVRPPFTPQHKDTIYVDGTILDVDTNYTWVDIPGWETEPDGEGALKLRFTTVPYDLEGRIIYWAKNGHLPVTVPTLGEDIVAATTSFEVDTNSTDSTSIGDTGWLLCGNEYMQYSGVVRSGSTMTLQNVVRGINNSTAASHSDGDSLYWCVAATRNDLLTQLRHQTVANLCAMFLTDASIQQREHYQWQLQWNQQMADQFWRGYVPDKQPQMVLARRGRKVA